MFKKSCPILLVHHNTETDKASWTHSIVFKGQNNIPYEACTVQCTTSTYVVHLAELCILIEEAAVLVIRGNMLY